MFWLLPLVGAAAGAIMNKKNPLAGAAMGAVGGAAPGLLGAAAPAAAATGAGTASGAGGLLAATGGQVGAGGIGSALAGGAMGAPVAPITMGSGLLAPGGIGAAGAAGGAAAGGGLMETMKPFMNAAKTGMETAQATQQPEEQMQPSPFIMPPQAGSGPQQMAQLVQSIEQDKAQRFPQRVRRY